MGEGKREKRTRTGRSLNLVLWFTFSVFAFAVIFIHVVAQNFLIGKQYREQMINDLFFAGNSISGAIAKYSDSSSASKELFEVANRYGVSFYLLYEDGTCVYPESAGQTTYPEIAEMLRNELSVQKIAVIDSGTELAYGTTVALDGRMCYLYLFKPIGTVAEYTGNFRWISIVTGLSAVVLAFIASGFVAMLITKPVSEVTERAKELARGHYDLNFRKDYFCSEITELSDALDHARAEISRADAMQKELIANVSHDFKTPLTMIKAYASMIREISGDNKEKRDAHAQIIIDESDRLAVLVGDLLDLSKLRAGLTEDARTVFNLSEEVYRITERFKYLCDTEGYVIETSVEDELYTLADRERIEQVLYNLIGNAVNYTGEDKRVRIKLFRKENSARFEVTDTGKGISPEEVDTIWDRYYRSSETHKRPVKGTGLGLSIVKSILLAQDCPFGVISEVGKGSCFWVEFPAPPEEHAEKGKKKKTEKKRKEEVQ